MREFDDAALELRLRRVLTERLGSLPLDLTIQDLEARQQARERARARRRPWVILGLAAVLALPAGWLAVGAPFPRPTVPQSTARNGAIGYTVNDIGTRPYNHAHVISVGGTDREIAQGTCPVFSKDGTRLAYWSGWAETLELVIANADGSSPQFEPTVGKYATVSPDLTQVAWFTRFDPGAGTILDRTNEVWVTPVSGGPGIRVAPKSDTPHEYYTNYPVWSPDGRRIAFTVYTQDVGQFNDEYRSAIYVVNADGSDLHLLTSRAGDSAAISWSPDGRYVAYDGVPDGTPLPTLGQDADLISSYYPPTHIFVVGTDGTGDHDLMIAAPAVGPVWSPDGSHLAYWGPLPEGEQETTVATVRMSEGSAIGPGVLGPEATSFVWSPDGTRLLLLHNLEVAGASAQMFKSGIRSVDAEFQQTPVTLREGDGYITCASWQRLEP